MKKTLLFLLTILFGLGTLQVSAQQLVEILGGGGTETSSYLPAYTLYNNTLSEQIYTASEVGMAGDITSIAFFNGGSEKTPNIKIYMVNTDKTEFTSNTDWLTVNSTNLVFEGNVTFTPGNWTTINLSTPFSYDGTNNLGIIVDEYMVWNSGLACRVFQSTSNCAMYVYSDDVDYNAVGANYTASSRLSVKNQIKLEITPSNVSCAAVGPLAITGVTSSNATVTWTNPNDMGTYILQYKTAAQSWEDSDVITDFPSDSTYDFSDLLSPNTTYNVRVANLCSNGDTSLWRAGTFTTPNIPVDLPYSQDFETNPESITDFTIQGSGSNQWAIGSATFKPVDPTDAAETGFSLYISENNGAANTYNISNTSYSYAILDLEFDNTPMEYHLSFDYKNMGEGSSTMYDYLSVYLMDGNANVPTNDIPSGTALLSQKTNVANWTHEDIILENVVGTAKKVVFFWRNDGTVGTQPPAAIDNISVIGYSCSRPNGIVLTGSSDESLSISWTENGSATSWSVFYREVGTTGDYTEVTVSGLPQTDIYGLGPDTRYELYVIAHCDGNEDSQASESATFRTECGPLTTLPYFNNFDDVISDNGTNFITCWSRYTTNPDRVVRCYGSATHSGAYSLDFNYSPSCTTAAVTPMLDTSIPLNTVLVDFWAFSSLGQGWMEVGTMSDPNDFSTYEFYDTVRLSTASSWENVIISFENYTGSNQYIAFLEINGTTTSYIFDDFTIDYIPNCMYPTNLAVDAISNNSVTLSWVESGTATSWAIEYGPAGFTVGEGTTVAANTIPFTVDNLTPATTYDFYVYADCGNDLSTPFGPVPATPGQYVFGVTGSDTLTTCGVILYDNGGPNGDYSNSCDFTLVLYPENPNAMMSLVGTLNTESISYDYLTIYDGVGTSTQLAKIGGTNQTVNVMSQSGPLTLVFHSDGTVVYSGFAIVASCVTCYPPVGVSASNLTTTSATISWSGNSDSYGVTIHSADGTDDYQETYDTFLLLSGLIPSSSYQVTVTGFCNGDTSMPSQPASFITECDALTITADNPWAENFEAYTSSTFVCWSTPLTYTANNGTFPMVYRNYGESCHSGVNSAEMKGPQLMLVLPEFTNSIQELRLSFWATATNTSAGNIQVGVITNLDDLTTFEAVANAGAPGPRGSSSAGNGNYMGPFDFNGAQATTGRIALLYTDPTASSTPGASGNQSWNLDDFVVELTPDCPSPVKTSVQATNVDGHNATITFVDNDPSHTSWTVYYKASNETTWSTATTYDTSVVLSGLDPETNYDVYVVTNCATPSATEDATQTIHFTTTVACPAPTNLTVTPGMTEAIVTWNGSADNYTVVCGDNSTTVSDNTITLTGLTASSSYTVSVIADCGIDGNSAPATATFSTAACELADQCSFTFIMNDSYGDGWNGASIGVQQNGITIASLTISGGYTSTQTIALCEGANITLVWNSGSFDSECSFEITNPYGETQFTASSVTAGTLTSFVAHCTPPTCPKPTLLAATDITASTITLDWQAGDSETSWEIAYGAPGFDPETATNLETVTSHPYIIQNLTDATTYQFYVRAICSVDDQSDWSVPVSATTPCGGALPIPYTMDFEGYPGTTYDDNNGIAPACWTTYSTNTSYGPPHITSSGSYHYVSSGSNSMVFTCSSSGSTAYAALPTFNEPLNTLKINFWRAMENTSYGELTVGYVTDLNNMATSYVSVATIPNVSSTSGDTISVNFNDASVPATGNICFRWYKDGTYYSCCIDDIYVNNADSTTPGPVITDPTVATTAATNLGQTAATLNGTITNPGNVTITAKGFQWKATIGGAYTPVTVTGDNLTYNLSGLTPNTSYTYKAFITFNGTTVEGSEMTFTTLPEDTPEPCDVPTGLTVGNVTHESIAISWNANPNVSSWNIQYKPVGGQLSSATATTNSYVITGLAPETEYQIQVQADCGDGNVSDWTAAVSATTTVGIENHLLNSISLYPNPASEVINVQCTMYNVQAIEVIDVYGKVVRVVETLRATSTQTAQINVSGLAAGIYFVRVTTDEGIATKSFVKK